jgi:iron complex transport system substrate-binding protein
MIETLSALVGASEKGARLVQDLRSRTEAARARSKDLLRPRVYFEEWDEPMISGIGWVSELVSIAGGDDVFPELACKKSARERIVTPEAVISAAPDIVIGSWCGKKFRPERIAARDGFAALPAVRDNFVREIKSTIILQPGPAALTDGLDAIEGIVNEWQAAKAGARGEPILRTG